MQIDKRYVNKYWLLMLAIDKYLLSDWFASKQLKSTLIVFFSLLLYINRKKMMYLETKLEILWSLHFSSEKIVLGNVGHIYTVWLKKMSLGLPWSWDGCTFASIWVQIKSCYLECWFLRQWGATHLLITFCHSHRLYFWCKLINNSC